jgi:hypothetical protein
MLPRSPSWPPPQTPPPPLPRGLTIACLLVASSRVLLAWWLLDARGRFADVMLLGGCGTFAAGIAFVVSWTHVTAVRNARLAQLARFGQLAGAALLLAALSEMSGKLVLGRGYDVIEVAVAASVLVGVERWRQIVGAPRPPLVVVSAVLFGIATLNALLGPFAMSLSGIAAMYGIVPGLAWVTAGLAVRGLPKPQPPIPTATLIQ